MRTAQRYYIVADDGAIRRVAVSTFHRIILQRTLTPFADLVGKRVRFAQITVQVDGRKPVGVRGASFGYLTFDDNGLFDSSEWDDAARATVESWPSPTNTAATSVLDARARFTDRRLELEHGWQPSDDLRKELFAKATGHT